jgi:MerR family transcriptional regulator/heat shock protein HspR
MPVFLSRVACRGRACRVWVHRWAADFRADRVLRKHVSAAVGQLRLGDAAELGGEIVPEAVLEELAACRSGWLAGDLAALDRGLFPISVAAELAGLHPQTLRIYEREGLLDPARSAGGTRRYSSRDIDRLQEICALTADGLNLAGIRRVLQLQEETRQLQAEVARLRELAGGRPAPAEQRSKQRTRRPDGK